ncbi:hypothetical protein I316_03471 [Kwoniella heveanensis BCC8398]|uniref:Uncharacterized protein n=1 Tax=Kwoniella heveanensis BCC8398 TaxID=1296120 RepID=A0A1B9GV75_9TREE|nr:hypothetical protein I316_03471 [Kwoniella heveanensis BCC8398]
MFASPSSSPDLPTDLTSTVAMVSSVPTILVLLASSLSQVTARPRPVSDENDSSSSSSGSFADYKFDPSAYEISDSDPSSSNLTVLSALDDAQFLAATWVPPTEVQTSPPSHRPFWITSDIDNCPYPNRTAFPVYPMPTDNYSEVINEPTLALWQAFRMDEWIQQAFDNCPAALAATVVGSNGQTAESFSTSLGRLMLGRTKDASFAPICNDFRCSWSTNGDASIRGQIFVQEQLPDVWDGMDDDHIEAYRRWYAMTALTNIWDYSQATSSALNLAVNVVNSELPTLINTFMPDYVAATAPPSPLGPFLDIINTIATFTPFGSFVNIAVTVAKSLADVDPTGAAKPNQLKVSEVNPDAVKYGETMSKEDRTALAKRMTLRRKALSTGVSNAILLTKQIGLLVGAVNDDGTPAHWDPVMPVKWAELSSQFGSVIASVATNLQTVNQARLNGDPQASGGYLDMVIGGLFSEWSNSGSTISALSLQNVLPMYVAYIEDKVFQNIMKNQQLWLLKRSTGDSESCSSMLVPDNWEGIACAESADNSTWYNYIPYMTDFAIEVDANTYTHGISKDFWATSLTQNQQKYNLLTQDNLNALRGSLTRDSYPASLADIYAQAEDCHQATNSALFQDGNGPTANCDGTSPMQLWPDAFDADGDFALDPTQLSCHWNIPIVEPSLGSTSCLNEQTDSTTGNPYYFIHGGDASGQCDVVFNGINGWREDCAGCWCE